MIAHIKGILAHKSFDQVVIDVDGIGYQVFIPLTTFSQLPDLYQPLSLNTCTYLKDNTIEIYGFLTTKEKDAFQMLIGISGVGTRLARNILSGITPDELYQAIKEKDIDRLNMIPGVGHKTAQRMIVELADKVKPLCEEEVPQKGSGAIFRDVVSALLNLGYKPSDAEKAVRKIRGEIETEPSFEDAFRRAIQILSGKKV